MLIILSIFMNYFRKEGKERGRQGEGRQTTSLLPEEPLDEELRQQK